MPFTEEHISTGILKKLLKQEIVKVMTYDEDAPQYLYNIGKPSNMFVLVIEGTVQVEIGHDRLQFPSSSFSHFGSRALMMVTEGDSQEYVPDFSVEIKSDCRLLVVTQMQYRAAYRATQFERKCKKPSSSQENIDPFKTEWTYIQNGIMESLSSKKIHTRKKKRPHGQKGSVSEESAMLLSEDYEDNASEPNESYSSAEVHYNSDDNCSSTRTNIILEPVAGLNETKM